ncbi:MAG: Mu transposase domain-containing protein, partial [Actinomycetota bacterium]
TTQRRPLEVFGAEEKDKLLAPPEGVYDLPIYSEPKVHPDHHIELAKALYSVPGHLIGHYVKARADRNLVKIYFRGKLIKTHPRKSPGERSTDPEDLPAEKAAYAMKDLEKLQATAGRYGQNVGGMAAAVLDNPLPWTKMRQVYRLLGLARRFGGPAVDEACRQALEFEAIDIHLVARMLERGREGQTIALAPGSANVVPLRFARSKEEFKVSGPGDGDAS